MALCHRHYPQFLFLCCTEEVIWVWSNDLMMTEVSFSVKYCFESFTPPIHITQITRWAALPESKPNQVIWWKIWINREHWKCIESSAWPRKLAGYDFSIEKDLSFVFLTIFQPVSASKAQLKKRKEKKKLVYLCFFTKLLVFSLSLQSFSKSQITTSWKITSWIVNYRLYLDTLTLLLFN